MAFQQDHFDSQDFKEFEGSAGVWRGAGARGQGVAEGHRPGRFSSEIVELFEMGELLGAGSFAWVHRAVSRSTGEEVAIKYQLADVYADEVSNEIEALREIENHSNIIVMHEVILGQENEQIYFVLELMDLSLEDTVKRMASQGLRFRKSELKSLWIQCLSGLSHVHKAGFVHNDVAARNVLLDKAGVVKISDFGKAVRQGQSRKSTQKDDVRALSVVFNFTVTQKFFGHLDDLPGKISSPAVQLIQLMYRREISARKALKARFFEKEPLPKPPKIGQLLSSNSGK